MLKRTKGCLLLTLLVITGLAGTVHDVTISQKERKFALTHLKDTKNDVLAVIKELSEAQLNFKPAPDKWSVKECFYHLTLAEKGLWTTLENSLKLPATPEARADLKINDEELLHGVTDREKKLQAPDKFKPANAPWHSMSQAVNTFKTSRADHLKYVKNTTEDLRDHIIQMPSGPMDCYQFILLISGHSNRHTQQILEIMTDPGFPSK